ncbi:MAG: hypothetical protein IPK67_16475 [Planctomycetes bacterium]|nr:hypothetical protein [Planctomycetota bacterium]
MGNAVLSKLGRCASASLVGVFLHSVAWCNTWIVDVNNGAGAHFTDIPPAIAAALPGDVILVRAGNYSAFTLNSGLSVIGQGLVRTSGNINLSSTPGGAVTALCEVQPSSRLNSIRVTGCAGTVLLQGLAAAVVIDASSDVRLSDCTTSPAPGMLQGLRVTNSRAQIVQSDFAGANGVDGTNCGDGTSGGAGVQCLGPSRVHFARSTAIGGRGGDALGVLCVPFAGDGGSGLSASAPFTGGRLELILTGGGVGLAQGGAGGVAPGGFDGFHGQSMLLSQNVIAWTSGMGYVPSAPLLVGGSTLIVTPTEEPTLELIGTPSPGAVVTLRLRAAPGVAARLNLGATPIVQPQSNILVESLVMKQRSFDRGLVPPSGIIDTPWSFQPGAPLGKLLIFQAKVTDPASGLTQKSNSIEAIVR